jgi:NADH-quinone oxidoreductase subunit C
MSQPLDSLKLALESRFGERGAALRLAQGELTLELPPALLLETCQVLRDELGFEQLTDVCGVDFSQYGMDEWHTTGATASGFSRGVQAATHGRGPSACIAPPCSQRFAAVYHLLSVRHNLRLRVRCYAPDDGLPVVPSVTAIWPAANWFEREAFDLFGIVFEGHPDLRRILTDYGFIGHPFRKDFPLTGHVEMRYDPALKRVVYEPVSIEPRVGVPRVVRKPEDGAEGVRA